MIGHYNGEVKFLTHKDRLYVNDIDSFKSPQHVLCATLLGFVSLYIAKQILFDPQSSNARTYELLGRSVLGGYAELVSENPLSYRFSRGSTSVPPATEDEFNLAQNAGNVTFHKFTSHDASDLINR